MAPQIYIFHIYTGPKFTKPTFTQNPDLHKLKFTQLRFTHTQIYTDPYWHTQIYTTQIYTKLNPNLQRHKLKLCQTVQSAKLSRMQVVLSAATPLTLRVAAATAATAALSFLS